MKKATTKQRVWKGIKITASAIAAILGFLSSVAGIYSWLGITSLKFGNVIIPDPIVIVISVVVTLLLIGIAFVGGAYYIISIIAQLFSGVLSKLVIPEKKSPQETPSKQEQEQVIHQ